MGWISEGWIKAGWISEGWIKESMKKSLGENKVHSLHPLKSPNWHKSSEKEVYGNKVI